MLARPGCKKKSADDERDLQYWVDASDDIDVGAVKRHGIEEVMITTHVGVNSVVDEVMGVILHDLRGTS
ncbi:hypothetical protein B296_00023910 [Ensete ventricosum]|uniref:Uncharacterized protein n=1 Tax=Ensete ventricosum TaxID=4639 RepID=A0A426ZNE6_ENSVE|nr:hypothetical protein B296_00023910 [Ensete ventricosum]